MSSELTCQDQASVGGSEPAVINATAGKDDFIFVDSTDTTTGTYTLQVAF